MQPMGSKSRAWMWIGIVALIFLAGSFIVVKIVIAHAEPILRARVLQTLSARFHGKVQLEGFGVAVGNGVQVPGSGLTIFGAAAANPYEPGIQPLLNVRQFRFQTSLRSLFQWPMHIDTVYVDGLELNIPPKGGRQEISHWRAKGSRASIFFDQIDCEDARLVIDTVNPNKPPLQFAIKHLTLKDVGPGRPFQFDATLEIPNQSATSIPLASSDPGRKLIRARRLCKATILSLMPTSAPSKASPGCFPQPANTPAVSAIS